MDFLSLFESVFFLPGQVSSEAVAAPIISEERRGPSRKKKKHRVSEPGALVIEHAEPSDAGQSGSRSACRGGGLARSPGPGVHPNPFDQTDTPLY